MHFDGNAFPNWTGTDQERVFTVTEDGLKQITPQAAISGTNTIIWKRIK